MTLHQFNRLDASEQNEVLWEKGIIVSERTENEFTVILYQLFSFYVELYYHEKINLVQNLISFSDTQRLNIYLQELDLRDILKM